MSETGQSPPETMSAFTGFPEDGGGRKRLDPTASKEDAPAEKKPNGFFPKERTDTQRHSRSAADGKGETE